MPLPYDYEQETKKLLGKGSCLTDVIDEEIKQGWMKMLDNDALEQKIFIKSSGLHDDWILNRAQNVLNDRLMIRNIIKNVLELPRCPPS